MTDFRPLLESSANARTRELLRAGLAERPSTRAVERTAAALGVGVALSTTTAGAAVLGGSAASAAGGASAIGALSIAKWLAVGAFSGTLVAGGAAFVQRASGSEREATAHTTAVTHEAGGDGRRVSNAAPEALRPTIPPPVAASGTAASGDASGVTQRSPALTLSPEVPAPPESGGSAASSALSLEVAHIDRARAALASGAAERTLEELARYRAIRTTGTLDREAWILRIDALLLLGKRGEAAELARGYLERFPKDAHATRLHELSGDGAKE